MKRKSLLIFLSLIISICLFTTPILATEEQEYEKETETACEVDDPECSENWDEIVQTAPFLTQAILSLDKEVAIKEMDKDYIRYFENSSKTAAAKSIDIWNLDLGWAFSVIITDFVEKISQFLITFPVMVLYNLTSNNTITSIVSQGLNYIESTFINWKDPNSWIVTILIFSTLLAFLSRIVANYRQVHTYTGVIHIAIELITTAALIWMVGVYGRPLITNVEHMIEESLTISFTDGTDIEIENKELIFDTLQMQPFRLRHFGVVTDEDIAKQLNISENEASQRVSKLLENPSTKNAKWEADNGNQYIIQSAGTASQVMGMSLLYFLHRILLGIIFLAFFLVLGIIRLLKEILIFLSVYQLVYCLMVNHKVSAWDWFFNRIYWSIFTVIANVVFGVALYWLNVTIAELVNIHPLMLLAFDAVFLAILFMFRKSIVDWIKNFVAKPQAIKTILSGQESPLEAMAAAFAFTSRSPYRTTTDPSSSTQSDSGNNTVAPSADDDEDLGDDNSSTDGSNGSTSSDRNTSDNQHIDDPDVSDNDNADPDTAASPGSPRTDSHREEAQSDTADDPKGHENEDNVSLFEYETEYSVPAFDDVDDLFDVDGDDL